MHECDHKSYLLLVQGGAMHQASSLGFCWLLTH